MCAQRDSHVMHGIELPSDLSPQDEQDREEGQPQQDRQACFSPQPPEKLRLDIAGSVCVVIDARVWEVDVQINSHTHPSARPKKKKKKKTQTACNPRSPEQLTLQIASARSSLTPASGKLTPESTCAMSIAVQLLKWPS